MLTRSEILHMAPALGIAVATYHAYPVADAFVAHRYGALAGAYGVPHAFPPDWIPVGALPGVIAAGSFVVPLLVVWAALHWAGVVPWLSARHPEVVGEVFDGPLGDLLGGTAAAGWLAARVAGLVALVVLAVLLWNSRDALTLSDVLFGPLAR